MGKRLITPAGHSIETWEGGEIIERHLYTCCHCQFTWEAPIGSMGGKLSGGFCGNCVGYICRNEDCLKTCVHYEQRLENREAGRPLLFKPTRISVPDTAFIRDLAHNKFPIDSWQVSKD